VTADQSYLRYDALSRPNIVTILRGVISWVLLRVGTKLVNSVLATLPRCYNPCNGVVKSNRPARVLISSEVLLGEEVHPRRGTHRTYSRFNYCPGLAGCRCFLLAFPQ
jgi:hypothetical protein